MSDRESNVARLKECLEDRANRGRRRSNSCSSDSVDKVKRRNACSKDKRKKSRHRSASSSSTSSSVSSPDLKPQKEKRQEKDRESLDKSREYKREFYSRRNNDFARDAKNYNAHRPQRSNWQGRGNSMSRFSYRQPYNRGYSYKRDRYNNRRNYFPNSNNRIGNYDRSRSRSNQDSSSAYRQRRDSRDASVDNKQEYHNDISKFPAKSEKAESAKSDGNATDARDKEIVSYEKKKARRSRKKSKKRRDSSSSSSSSTSSSSSSSSSSESTSSSSSSRSSSSSSDTSEDEKKRKKQKKKAKKMKKLMKKRKKKKKKLKKKLKKKARKSKRKSQGAGKGQTAEKGGEIISKDAPVEITERAKAMAPMTKEEWERQQSVVRRVYDEDTGRYRLIKGDGEVLEEIVSRERHKEINKQATKGDGDFFQARLTMNMP